MNKNKLKRGILLGAMVAAHSFTSKAYELELNKYNTNLPPIDFHGFASQGALFSSGYDYLGQTKDGSVKFTELGLNASFNPFPRTRITVQGFDYSVGNVGQYNVLLDYALIEYTATDWLGIRGGRVRRPGGLYNHIQDVDLARTAVLLPQGIYDARWRDFSGTIDGGELFGNINAAKAGSFSYEAYAGFVNMRDNGGVARTLQNSLYTQNLASAPYANTTYQGIDQSVIAGGQLWWNTPVDGLKFGGSGGALKDFGYNFLTTGVVPVGMPPTLFPFSVSTHSVGDIPFAQFSGEYLWKNWTFQAEYYTYHVGSRTYQNGVYSGDSISDVDSWYVNAAYKVNKWLQTGLYYTEYYGDTHHRGNSRNYQKDTALSFRFDIKDWWIVKLEGHYIHGTALLQDDRNNPVQNNNAWFMLAAKTTFSF